MGLEVVATALAVGGQAYQMERSREAAKQQRRSADLQKEANAQQSAQAQYERRKAIKQQAREARVRQAQVMSAAQASGVSGSSIEATTLGAGQTLAQAGQAFATGQSMTASNVSSLNQQAADARSSAQFDLAQGQMGSAFADMGRTGMSFAAGGQ